jgi:hypothetical protein
MGPCAACLRLAALAAALTGPALAAETPAPAPGEPTLAEVRAATERYRDIEVALAVGYLRDPADHCETADTVGRAAAEGGMGIRYVRPDLLGVAAPPNPRVDGNGTYTDFAAPAILRYAPLAHGSLTLVGVENLVFKAAWEAAGNTAPPAFHGVAWDLMRHDPGTETVEAHGFASHDDRHVWIHRENPSGVFAPFNPNASCDHHARKGDH